MESITIKVDETFAREIERAMKPLYSTRTEFIREAVRDKIKQQDKERRLELLEENFGKGVPRTNKTDREIREEVSREIAKKHGFDELL